MKLLIADDDAVTRTAINHQLEDAGYKTVVAIDGNEAWDALNNGNIQLAILDWNMPGKTGVEICKLAQNLGRLVYIIIMTGEMDSSFTTTALESGASDYLTKPWVGDVLLSRVNVGLRTILLHTQLAHAQKLESIGQLAAGIAHEINTPTQFVSDNTRFLQSAFPKLQIILTRYARLLRASRSGSLSPQLIDEVEAAIKTAKLEFLCEQIPEAISDTLEGLERVTQIVRAMKDFSHPGEDELRPNDLNKAIESTVIVARSEWKYVAELTLDLDPSIPPVPCAIADINQVILNLVVNAAHAISEAMGTDSNDKGKIKISTRGFDNLVEILIQDNGIGIPEEYSQRVYDPFFTTKGVGKGTGQGLAIAYSAITEKHHGTIGFESEAGYGTTFSIRLPLVQNTGDSCSVRENEVNPVRLLK